MARGSVIFVAALLLRLDGVLAREYVRNSAMDFRTDPIDGYKQQMASPELPRLDNSLLDLLRTKEDQTFQPSMEDAERQDWSESKLIRFHKKELRHHYVSLQHAVAGFAYQHQSGKDALMAVLTQLQKSKDGIDRQNDASARLARAQRQGPMGTLWQHGPIYATRHFGPFKDIREKKIGNRLIDFERTRDNTLEQLEPLRKQSQELFLHQSALSYYKGRERTRARHDLLQKPKPDVVDPWIRWWHRAGNAGDTGQWDANEHGASPFAADALQGTKMSDAGSGRPLSRLKRETQPPNALERLFGVHFS